MSCCVFPLGAAPPKISQTFYFVFFEPASKAMSDGGVLRCTPYSRLSLFPFNKR